MFEGAIVAIVTPFKNGKIDESALRELIEFQIKNGTDGIVPCGTTGESSTLSHKEHDRVIEITIDAVKKRVPVIAGTGSIVPMRPFDLRSTLIRRVRTVRSWSARITIGHPRKGSIFISRRSPRQFRSPLYLIISQAGPEST